MYPALLAARTIYLTPDKGACQEYILVYGV